VINKGGSDQLGLEIEIYRKKRLQEEKVLVGFDYQQAIRINDRRDKLTLAV
jgi:hypothetical protein